MSTRTIESAAYRTVAERFSRALEYSSEPLQFHTTKPSKVRAGSGFLEEIVGQPVLAEQMVIPHYVEPLNSSDQTAVHKTYAAKRHAADSRAVTAAADNTHIVLADGKLHQLSKFERYNNRSLEEQYHALVELRELLRSMYLRSEDILMLWSNSLVVHNGHPVPVQVWSVAAIHRLHKTVLNTIFDEVVETGEHCRTNTIIDMKYLRETQPDAIKGVAFIPGSADVRTVIKSSKRWMRKPTEENLQLLVDANLATVPLPLLEMR